MTSDCELISGIRPGLKPSMAGLSLDMGLGATWCSISAMRRFLLQTNIPWFSRGQRISFALRKQEGQDRRFDAGVQDCKPDWEERLAAYLKYTATYSNSCTWATMDKTTKDILTWDIK